MAAMGHVLCINGAALGEGGQERGSTTQAPAIMPAVRGPGLLGMDEIALIHERADR